MRYEWKPKGVKESLPGNFPLIPEGEYIGKVDSVVTTDGNGDELTSRNGDPIIRVRIKIEVGEYKDQLLFHQLVLLADSKPGAGIAYHFLKVLGETYNTHTETWSINTARWPFLNSFKVVVKHETYEGKIRAKVDYVDYINDAEKADNGTKKAKDDTLEGLII